MANEAYMLARPSPPGAMKRALDRVMLPGSINLVYKVEMLAQELAEQARRAPVTGLLAALACGYVLRGIIRRA